MQLLCQPEIPIRKVDEHGNVRTPPVYLRQQLVEFTIDSRQMAQHFKQPNHGYIAGMDYYLAACLAHALAAHAEAFDCARVQLAKRRQ